MIRRALEALCIDKNTPELDLPQRNKSLKEENIITKDIADWADDLSFSGKTGAHPEWEDVTEDEAEYGVDCLHEIIKFVYVNSARRNKTKLKDSKDPKDKN